MAMRLPVQSGIHEIPAVRRPFFIADLHLSGKKLRTILTFFSFLKKEALQCDALFILGDLFEYWIGDDAAEPAKPVVKALKKFTATGRRLYFMQGNRDTLLGEDFCADCGGALLATPALVKTESGKTLYLTHGDEWCLLDKDYQDFRRMMRDVAFQQKAFAMTVEERIAWAKNARRTSVTQKKEKTREEMDVVTDAVLADLKKHPADAVIHGHVHRPASYRMGNTVRAVIPDWRIDGAANPVYGWVQLNSLDMPVVTISRRVFPNIIPKKP